MATSVKFCSDLAPSYLRNNRSTGQKSLRCFPSCDPKGHSSGGKCGVPLKVSIKMKTPSSMKLEDAEYLFIAEIRPLEKPRLSSQKYASKSSVLSQIRSKGESSARELFLGEAKSFDRKKTTTTIEVEFNSYGCSWDYSWKSNRWCTESHVVDIIVLRTKTPLEYEVCSSHISSPFIVLSSHKSYRNTVSTTSLGSEEDETLRDHLKNKIKEAARNRSTPVEVTERECDQLQSQLMLIKKSNFAYDIEFQDEHIDIAHPCVGDISDSDSETEDEYFTTELKRRRVEDLHCNLDDIIELPTSKR